MERKLFEEFAIYFWETSIHLLDAETIREQAYWIVKLLKDETIQKGK
jgi:hypothetical protein